MKMQNKYKIRYRNQNKTREEYEEKEMYDYTILKRNLQ